MDTSLGYKNPSRNLLVPHRKQPLFYTPRKGKSVSGRSTQSTLVICKTLYHTVESFGVPVPVQITEALAFCDSNVVCSASISCEGWAWFVIGRRLLIWQAINLKNSFSFGCKELTLPPSDLAYSANLISVSTSHGNHVHVVSCIVVSPEGLIRYWPNVNNEGVSVESNANLQGQECETLKRINTIGFILATTTATLLLIEAINVGGRHSVVCRQLITPSGWFGEIGRRFSSILFGGHSAQNVETKLIRVFVSEMITPITSSGSKSYSVFALAGFILQKWCLSLGQQEKFMFECNLEPLIVENFLQTVWNAPADHDINIHLIDMQLMSSTSLSVIILAAASNNTISNQLHYALVVVNVETESAPTKTSSFIVLKNVNFSVFDNDFNAKNIYLLVSGQSVYGYNSRYVVSFPFINGYDETDLIDLSETCILGGAVINEIPVFFSRIHGFISVNASDVVSPLDFANCSSLSIEISNVSETLLCDNPDLQSNAVYKDSKVCMKAAFLYYVSKKSNHAKTMMNDLFPMSETPLQVDSALDLVAINVSLDLINDIPAKDPRWADVKLDENIHFNSMSSLQIQNQLEEKQQALDWFISFLREMGLWNRLGAVTWNKVVMATSYVFAEQSEKLIAAIALKKLQSKYPQLLETVIKEVVKNEEIVPSNSLTAYDLFYRKVSIVHKALIQLCSHCEDFVCQEHKMQHVVKTITDTNTILLQILEEISIFRQEKGIIFVPNSAVMSSFNAEVLSWTAAGGKNGLKESLVLMSGITFEYGIKCVGILTQKKELINQLISLNSIILEGWKIHVESIFSRKARYEILLHQYENERSALIQPFMELEEYELAATLAEKYLDFAALIQICEKTKNPNRLLHYVDKYEKKEFSQFLFSWYVREKKQDQLLKEFGSNKKLQAALSRFLTDHPSIAWLHAVYCNNYEQASEILLNLALQEMESLKRKKYMLALSKLALLASADFDSNLAKKVNMEINLLNYQEDLPETVLHVHGYDSETTRVFLPAELIRLYICEENTNASEFDFNKALDLLHFIEDEGEREDLRYEIWSKSILRDAWPESTAEISDPVEYVSQFLFFRILQFGLEKGTGVLSMLPPLEKLLESEELASLGNDATCQYLLKVGYECYVARSQVKGTA